MTAPFVIVTRAEPGASQTAKRVNDLGCAVIKSPAISLQLAEPVPELALERAAGLIFTSANGVRFFAQVSAERSITAWCVGPATFSEAESAGFQDIRNADGDSRDLIELIKREADKRAGHLVHIANTAAAGNVRGELTDIGFDVRFAGLYTPVDTARLSPGATEAIYSEVPICVLIHSAKGAKSFARLAQNNPYKNLTFICVSESAAAPILGLGQTQIAARPNEEELLRALKDWMLAL